MKAHRQAWVWQDSYHGLTIEDIRQLEYETQEMLQRLYAEVIIICLLFIIMVTWTTLCFDQSYPLRKSTIIRNIPTMYGDDLPGLRVLFYWLKCWKS